MIAAGSGIFWNKHPKRPSTHSNQLFTNAIYDIHNFFFSFS